jgi:hypothetical protein
VALRQVFLRVHQFIIIPLMFHTCLLLSVRCVTGLTSQHIITSCDSALGWTWNKELHFKVAATYHTKEGGMTFGIK